MRHRKGIWIAAKICTKFVHWFKERRKKESFLLKKTSIGEGEKTFI